MRKKKEKRVLFSFFKNDANVWDCGGRVLDRPPVGGGRRGAHPCLCRSARLPGGPLPCSEEGRRGALHGCRPCLGSRSARRRACRRAPAAGSALARRSAAGGLALCGGRVGRLSPSGLSPALCRQSDGSQNEAEAGLKRKMRTKMREEKEERSLKMGSKKELKRELKKELKMEELELGHQE